MTNKYDIYDYFLKKTFKLSAVNRLNLRISLNLSIKIAFFYYWYIELIDDSKFTSIAIGINLAIWPFYHLLVLFQELKYMGMFESDLLFRRQFFKILDFFQNSLLLIEFLLLVFKESYQTAFHLIILILLLLDLILLIVQICLRFRKQYQKKKRLNQYQANNTKNLAIKISQKIERQHQEEQIELKPLSEKLEKRIEQELIGRHNRGDIVLKLAVGQDNQLVFETDQLPNQQNIASSLIFSESESSQKESEVKIQQNYKSYTLFMLTFIIGSFFSSYILYNYFKDLSDDNLLFWAQLEILGNFFLVLTSIYYWCKYDRCKFCGELTNVSWSKIITSLIQGFACGLTTILYGLPFAIIIIIIIIIFVIFICCLDWSYDECNKQITCNPNLCFLLFFDCVLNIC